jgi:hypothetical protein
MVEIGTWRTSESKRWTKHSDRSSDREAQLLPLAIIATREQGCSKLDQLK